MIDLLFYILIAILFLYIVYLALGVLGHVIPENVRQIIVLILSTLMLLWALNNYKGALTL